MLPPDLPDLPLPSADPHGGGDNLYVRIIRDRFARYVAVLLSKDTGEVEDRMAPEFTAYEAIMAVSRNYPQAYYRKRYKRSRTRVA